jgi:hypothetical protein
VVSRQRSLAGPVVLIIVGVVLLLANMHVLPWARFWLLYAKFWPALIILWGIIKLVEYQKAQREGSRASGIGAGGVFLLIFLIVTGLAATQATRVNWHALGDEIDLGDDFSVFGDTFSYDDQMEQAFPAGSSLHVICDRGTVSINASEEDKIKVIVRKRVRAENQQEADKYNQGTKPLISSSEHTVTLNANTQGAGGHGVATDMDIFIPRKAAVTVSSRRGDVNVIGRQGDVELSAQKGDVTVEDVAGNVRLSLEKSSVRASRIAGDVSVQGRGNEVSFSEIKGALRLEGEFYDSINMEKVGKTVTFKSARTDMEFAGLDGSLKLDRGDLEASSMAGPLRLSTKSKDIRLEGVTGDVRLENSRGVIELRVGRLPVGNLQITNKDADIQIMLPEQAGFTVDARTRNGEIQSDFSQLKVDNRDDNGTATGTVGSGGGRLQISNEHGGIEIRKGTSLAATPPTPPTPPTPKTPGTPKALPAPKAPPAEPTEN